MTVEVSFWLARKSVVEMVLVLVLVLVLEYGQRKMLERSLALFRSRTKSR